MINFIVSVDETKEPKEVIDFLKQHHRTLIYCEDCAYNIKGQCLVNLRYQGDKDFCSFAQHRLFLSCKYGEIHVNKQEGT